MQDVKSDYEFFESSIRVLGFSKASFARKFEVHPGTISRWKKNGVPVWVSEYLRVVLKIKGFQGEDILR